MPSAKARHIVVSDESLSNQLKQAINAGADFSELAMQYSECTTARHGGDLGNFAPGQMDPVIDDAVFNGPIGVLQGPLATSNGYHLLIVQERK